MPKSQVANVYSSACPSRRVMAVLAEKWTLLIVAQLADGPHGGDRRCVDGISGDADQTPRKLESFGLVSRRSYRKCRRGSSTA
jgi:DNA-binding HxlR family transcriptional regulator